MASWSVYEPRETEPQTFEAADRSAFVKDGWCWPALLIPPIWLVYRRMWLGLLGWLGVVAALSVAERMLAPPAGLVPALEVMFALWFALEANALRRWTLARQGWRFAGIAAGADRVDAEQRFFAGRTMDGFVSSAPPRSTVNARSRSSEGVIGVFPEPYGRGP
jgi:hypothetical protein